MASQIDAFLADATTAPTAGAGTIDAFLADVTPPAQASESDFTGGLVEIGKALVEAPRQAVGAAASAIRAGEGVEKKDLLGGLIDWSKKGADEFMRQKGATDENTVFLSPPVLGDITFKDIRELPKNLGFTLTSGIAGLGVGVPISLIPAPGTAPAAWAAGTGAAGVAAYRMAKDQLVSDVRDALNNRSVQTTGQPLSDQDWTRVRADIEDAATRYGLWEAIPEALGQATGLKIIRMPAKRFMNLPGMRNVLSRTVAKAAAILGTELGTETVTQIGQGGVEAELGMRPEAPGVGEAFKEIAPQTALLTALMGGAGAIGSKVYDRATGRPPPTPPTPPKVPPVAPAPTVTAPPPAIAGAPPPPPAPPQPAVPGERAVLQAELDKITAAIPPGVTPAPNSIFGRRLADLQTRIDALPVEEAPPVVSRETPPVEPPPPAAPQVQPETVEPPIIPPPPGAAPAFEPPIPVGTTVNVTLAGETEPVGTAEVSGYRPGKRPRVVFKEPVSGLHAPFLDLVRLTPVDAPVEPAPVAPVAPPQITGDGASDAPVKVVFPEDVTRGAEVTVEPTPAQAEAGNYRKRHVNWQGLDISIETEAGQTRSGVASDGTPWSVTMPVPYGYIRRTEAIDGDQIDIYIGPDPQAQTVRVVDQIDPATGAFDEHKVMVGFPDGGSAVAAYDAAFSDGSGPSRRGAGTVLDVPAFKAWIAKGNTKAPLAYKKPKTPPATPAVGPTAQTGAVVEPPAVPAQVTPGAPVSENVDDATGLPMNPDGTVTLFHGTTETGAAEIRKTGTLIGKEDGVFLTTDRDAAASFGGAVVPIRVKPERLQIDDEFPTGRKDFRIPTARIGDQVRVDVADEVDPFAIPDHLRRKPGEVPPAPLPAPEIRMLPKRTAVRAPKPPEVIAPARLASAEKRVFSYAAENNLDLSDEQVTAAARAHLERKIAIPEAVREAGGKPEAEAVEAKPVTKDPYEALFLDAVDRAVKEGGGWAQIRNIKSGAASVWDLVRRGVLEENDGFVRRAADPAKARMEYAKRLELQRSEDAEAEEAAAAAPTAPAPTPAPVAAAEPVETPAPEAARKRDQGEMFSIARQDARTAFDAQEEARIVERIAQENFARYWPHSSKDVYINDGGAIRRRRAAPPLQSHLESARDVFITANGRAWHGHGTRGSPLTPLEGDALAAAIERARGEMAAMRDRSRQYMNRFDATAEQVAAAVDSVGLDTRIVFPDDTSSRYVYVAMPDGSEFKIRIADHDQPNVGGRPVGGFSKTIGRRHEAADVSVDPVSGMTVGDAVRAALEHAGRDPSDAPGEMFSIGRDVTQTPEFKRWFGDSKVVDENGEPLVVYHATPADFDAFSETGGPFGDGAIGSHFGTQDAANARAREIYWVSVKVLKRQKKYFPSLQVMPVYLSIRNPLRMRDMADRIVTEDGERLTRADVEAQGRTHEPGITAQAWEDPGDVAEALLDDGVIDIDKFEEVQGDFEAIKGVLWDIGYDGIVYENAIEDAGSDSYIAFFPEQIKSAIGNRGTFDPTDPRIAYSLGREGEAIRPDFNIDRVLADLIDRLRAIDPKGRIALRLKETIESARTGKATAAQGRYLNRLIEVALSAAAKGEGTWVLNHEAIHGLRDLVVFRDAEWAALEKAALADETAMQEVRDRYAGQGLSEEALIEERVADMFADWAAKRKPAQGFVLRAFQRVRAFLKGFAASLRKAGYRTVEDIFEGVEAGKVGGREGVNETALRETDEAFALWPRRTATPRTDLERDLSTVMDLPEKKSVFRHIADTLTAWRLAREDIINEVVRGLFDKFNPVKVAETRLFGDVLNAAVGAFKMMHATTNMSSTMATVVGVKTKDGIVGGALRYNDKTGKVELVEGSKPLSEIFRPVAALGGEAVNAWKAWAIARRAKMLMAEDREKNVPQWFIDKYENIDREYMRDGRNVFQSVFDDWRTFNNQMLDFAEQAGTINKEQRALWDDAFYIPFYRIIEEETLGPGVKSGIANQTSGIKRLTGGEDVIGDVIENIVLNTTKLVDSSFKTIAMSRAMPMLEAAGDVTEEKADWRQMHAPVPAITAALKKIGVHFDKLTKEQREQWLAVFAMAPPRGKDIVFFMDKGKRRYFRVQRPDMLAALTAMHPEQMNVITKTMGWVKGGFTELVTADPAFMIANGIRDTLHAWIITHGKVKLGTGAARGFRKALEGSPELISIMAAGYGTGGFYKNSSIRKVIESPAHQRTILGRSKDAYDAYRKLGFASEYMNRIARYEAGVKGGEGPAEAAYQAQDLLNFSAHGAWKVTKFLTTTVPFMNARLQGLHRLGRGYKEDPRAFLLHAGLLTAASLALWFVNKDDDRYKDLKDWDKDTYYHFFLDNLFPDGALDAAGIPTWMRHIRLPKPFEIGAFFSTIPERMALLASGDDKLRHTLDSVQRILLDTFAFNPLPQAIKPIIEQVADKIFFTLRPIEGMRYEGLRPEARYGPDTSETARLLGKALPEWAGDLRSPVRLEHLVRGYFGTIGMYVLGASDAILRPLATDAEAPTRRLDQYPVVQRFLRLDPPFSTKWMTEFYDMKREVDAIHQTLNKYQREGDREAYKKLRVEKAAELRLRERLNDAYDHMRNLDRRIERVKTSTTMDADRKREMIDKYLEQKNRVARRYGNLRPD